MELLMGKFRQIFTELSARDTPMFSFTELSASVTPIFSFPDENLSK